MKFGFSSKTWANKTSNSFRTCYSRWYFLVEQMNTYRLLGYKNVLDCLFDNPWPIRHSVLEKFTESNAFLFSIYSHVPLSVRSSNNFLTILTTFVEFFGFDPCFLIQGCKACLISWPAGRKTYKKRKQEDIDNIFGWWFYLWAYLKLWTFCNYVFARRTFLVVNLFLLSLYISTTLTSMNTFPYFLIDKFVLLYFFLIYFIFLSLPPPSSNVFCALNII